MNPDPIMLQPGLMVWSFYEPTIKTELGSTAVSPGSGRWIVIDPVGEPDRFPLPGQVEAVWLTNGNHWRTTDRWRHVHGCPVIAPPGAAPGLEGRPDALWTPTLARAVGVELLSLEGGGPGETAYWWPAPRRWLLVGDALVNLASHPFQPLPARYCEDARQLQKSLARLAELEPEVITFAHGTPLLGPDCAPLRRLSLSHEHA